MITAAQQPIAEDASHDWLAHAVLLCINSLVWLAIGITIGWMVWA